MSDIYKLYDEVDTYGQFSADYVEKMIHHVPDVPVVDRAEFLVSLAKGQVVLDFGATGPMSELLQRAAGEYHGTDIVSNGNVENFYRIDLDRTDDLPQIDGLQLIVAGEVIEHLSNAGHFLDLIHGYGVPVVLTTPNAFTSAGKVLLQRKIECVNREHVAWYSYHTLKVLVERHKFRITKWFWYNGKPLTAEGLVFLMEPSHGEN